MRIRFIFLTFIVISSMLIRDTNAQDLEISCTDGCSQINNSFYNYQIEAVEQRGLEINPVNVAANEFYATTVELSSMPSMAQNNHVYTDCKDSYGGYADWELRIQQYISVYDCVGDKCEVVFDYCYGTKSEFKYTSMLGYVKIETGAWHPIDDAFSLNLHFSGLLLCGAGFHGSGTEFTDTSCIACETGKYKEIPGNSSCIDCETGTFTKNEGATSCVTCAENLKEGADSDNCCLGLDDSYICNTCPHGQYAPGWNATSCVYCPAGKAFSNDADVEVCSNCPHGKYNNNTFTTCIDCGEGKATEMNVHGATSCIDCPIGKAIYGIIKKYWDTANVCKSCEPGKYNNNTGSECIYCEGGKAAPDMSSGATSCVDCPENTYSKLITYQSFPTFPTQISMTVCSPCNDLLPNSVSESGATRDGCVCDAGYFVSTDQSYQQTCIACPEGKIKNETGNEECVVCNIGYFLSTEQNNQINCIACPEGKMKDVVGNAAGCTGCGLDKIYNMATNSCQDCESGKHTAGLTDSSECFTLGTAAFVITCAEGCNCGDNIKNPRTTVGVEFVLQKNDPLDSYYSINSELCIWYIDRVVTSGESNTEKIGELNIIINNLQFKINRIENNNGVGCSEFNDRYVSNNFFKISECMQEECEEKYSISTQNTNDLNKILVETSQLSSSTGRIKIVTYVKVCVDSEFELRVSGKTVCPPGATGQDGGTCVECELGTHKDISGSSECTSCIAGTYASSTGMSVCTSCPLNSESVEIVGSNTSEDCGMCNSGYGGDDCILCPLGKFHYASTDYREFFGNECTNCTVGTYGSFDNTNGYNYNTCFNCPDHASTVNLAGQTRCFCDKGYEANYDDDWFKCTTCQKGFYKIEEISEKCIPCPVDTYASSEGAETCVACETGKYTANSTGFSNCILKGTPPFLVTDGFAQDTYFSAGGVLKFDVYGTTQTKRFTIARITENPAAHVIEITRIDITNALGTYLLTIHICTDSKCQYKHTMYTDITTPLEIQGAYIQVELHTETQIRIDDDNPQEVHVTWQYSVKCGAGFGSEDTGATCTQCASGKYSAEISTGPCTVCGPSTYATHTSATACTQCPTHASSPAASTQITDCFCEPTGYIWDNTSNTCKCMPGFSIDTNTEICEICGRGSYQEALDAAHCEYCPANTFSNEIGATTSDVCNTCETQTHTASERGYAQCLEPGIFPVNITCPEDTPAGCGCFPTWSNASGTIRNIYSMEHNIERCEWILSTDTYEDTGKLEINIELTYGNSESSFYLQIDECTESDCTNICREDVNQIIKCNNALNVNINGYKRIQIIARVIATQSIIIRWEFQKWCAPGWSIANDTGFCAWCPAGYIKGEWGVDACTICPANTYSDTDNTNCLQCPEKQKSTPGSDVCSCNTGYENFGQDCNDCANGYYKVDETNKCIPCDFGFYKSTGMSACASCPVNTFSGDVRGAVSCEPCSSGFSTKNQPGSYTCWSDSGINEVIVKCSGNCLCNNMSYISGGATGYITDGFPETQNYFDYYRDVSGSGIDRDCTWLIYPLDRTGGLQVTLKELSFPDSYRDKINVYKCDDINCATPEPYLLAETYHFDEARFKVDTPINVYNNSIIKIHFNAVAGREPNANTYTGFNISYNYLFSCGPGYYQEPGVELCMPCLPGTYKHYNGNQACTRCDVGKYASNNASSVCDVCPDNTTSFQGAATRSECICDRGYTLIHQDTVFNSCVSCTTGMYKNSTGSAGCTACPYNTFSGEFSAVSITTCSVCPENTATVYDGRSSIKDCLCIAGYKLENGSCTPCNVGKYKNITSSVVECTLCPQNTYSNTSAAAYCAHCPGNSVSDPGSTSLDSCKCDVGFSGLDGGLCTKCAADHYKNNIGNISNCIDRLTVDGNNWSTSICDVNNIVCGIRDVKFCGMGDSIQHCCSCQGVEHYWSRSHRQSHCKGNQEYSTSVFAEICNRCPPHTVSGEGSVSRTDCKCQAGYTGPDGGWCSACAVGTIKTTVGSESCVPCPNNTSPDIERITCKCNNGNTTCIEETAKEITAIAIKTTSQSFVSTQTTTLTTTATPTPTTYLEPTTYMHTTPPKTTTSPVLSTAIDSTTHTHTTTPTPTAYVEQTKYMHTTTPKTTKSLGSTTTFLESTTHTPTTTPTPTTSIESTAHTTKTTPTHTTSIESTATPPTTLQIHTTSLESTTYLTVSTPIPKTSFESTTTTLKITPTPTFQATPTASHTETLIQRKSSITRLIQKNITDYVKHPTNLLNINNDTNTDKVEFTIQITVSDENETLDFVLLDVLNSVSKLTNIENKYINVTLITAARRRLLQIPSTRIFDVLVTIQIHIDGNEDDPETKGLQLALSLIIIFSVLCFLKVVFSDRCSRNENNIDKPQPTPIPTVSAVVPTGYRCMCEYPYDVKYDDMTCNNNMQHAIYYY